MLRARKPLALGTLTRGLVQSGNEVGVDKSSRDGAVFVHLAGDATTRHKEAVAQDCKATTSDYHAIRIKSRETGSNCYPAAETN
jgi:hypothetical protein